MKYKTTLRLARNALKAGNDLQAAEYLGIATVYISEAEKEGHNVNEAWAAVSDLREEIVAHYNTVALANEVFS